MIDTNPCNPLSEDNISSYYYKIMVTEYNSSGSPGFRSCSAELTINLVVQFISTRKIPGSTPIQAPLGYTPDISMLLYFVLNKPIYYAVNDASFPSDTKEVLGTFVGVAENVGHLRTF